MTTQYLNAFFVSLPAIVLFFLVIFQLLINLNVNKIRYTKMSMPYSLLLESGIILFITLLLQWFDKYNLTKEAIFFSVPTAKYLKIILLGFSLLFLPAISKSLIFQRINSFEYYIFFLIINLVSILLISSYDYLYIYILIEAQALSFYVLVMSKRDSIFTTEAALHYFIISALISCLFVFSLVVIYSCYGTLNMFELEFLLINKLDSSFNHLFLTTRLGRIAMLCIILSLLAKIGLFPFHFWVPKVYEGSPLATTIIFSYIPKIVFFNLLIKICNSFNLIEFKFLWYFFIIVGLGSAFIGSLFAAFQTRLKRMLIYSSISQIGFPAFMFCFWDNHSSFLFKTLYIYLFMYIVSGVMSWSYYVLLYQYLNKNQESKNTTEKQEITSIYLTDLQSIYQSHREFSFFSAISFFSFAGMPPFLGFLSKIFIINELITFHIYPIILTLLFFSVISTFYYLQLIKIVFFEKKRKKDVFFFTYYVNEFFSDYLYQYSAFCFIFCLFLSTSQFFMLDLWLDLGLLVANTCHHYCI